MIEWPTRPITLPSESKRLRFSKSDLVFSRFSESDLDEIVAVEQAASLHPWKRSDFLSSIHSDHLCVGIKSLSDRSSWAAHAVVMSAVDVWELLILAVSPEYKRSGLATLLLSELMMQFAQCNDGDQVYLEVRASNSSAIALYQKVGFVQVGCRKNYYSSVDSTTENNDQIKEDALLFSLDLTALRN